MELAEFSRYIKTAAFGFSDLYTAVLLFSMIFRTTKRDGERVHSCGHETKGLPQRGKAAYASEHEG